MYLLVDLLAKPDLFHFSENNQRDTKLSHFL